MGSKRILITTGGTGGHVFPAQGLAQQLTKRDPSIDILFAGGGLSSNRYFDQAQFPFKEVACAPILVANPMKLVKGSGLMLKGIWQSMQLINRYRPDVVVGFGSFYTVPILAAAKIKRVPIVLHVADSIPGKANKWFAPFADYVGVHFPSSAALINGQVVEVGMPLREGFQSSAVSEKEAVNYFKLNDVQRTLLIFGGSQGAQAINRLIVDLIPRLKNWQVIHITGSLEESEKLKRLYEENRIRACVKPFEKRMELAWKMADLFIGRAGASTIAEAMEFGVPGILIPYPFAAEAHQDRNAEFFSDTVEGGVKLTEKGLTGEKLLEALEDFKIWEHKKAIDSYKRIPRMDLCQLVLKVAKQERKGH